GFGATLLDLLSDQIGRLSAQGYTHYPPCANECYQAGRQEVTFHYGVNWSHLVHFLHMKSRPTGGFAATWEATHFTPFFGISSLHNLRDKLEKSVNTTTG